jgi:hypothetical protein
MKDVLLILALGSPWILSGAAQNPEGNPPRQGERPLRDSPAARAERFEFDGPPPPGREAMFPGGGPDGFGPPTGVQERRSLVKQFDRDGDGRLNTAERKAAREFLAQETSAGRGCPSAGPADSGAGGAALGWARGLMGSNWIRWSARTIRANHC